MKRKMKSDLEQCVQSMSNLKVTFNTGWNRHGEYGRNIREDYARWAETYKRLTGKEAEGIYK